MGFVWRTTWRRLSFAVSRAPHVRCALHQLHGSSAISKWPARFIAEPSNATQRAHGRCHTFTFDMGDPLSRTALDGTGESHTTAPGRISNVSPLPDEQLLTAPLHKEHVPGRLIENLCLDVLDWALESHPHLINDSDLRPISARVMREMTAWRKLRTEKHQWFSVRFIGESLRFAVGSFEGPPNSPYEGGVFHILFCLSSQYPQKPPGCLMFTQIWHPNISARGEICMDALEHRWSPNWTLDSLSVAIASLLDEPNMEEVLVREIAHTHVRDPFAYERIARTYTQRFAHEVSPTFESVDRFVEMCTRLLNTSSGRQGM
jgi:ubiquitin-protein ligase